MGSSTPPTLDVVSFGEDFALDRRRRELRRSDRVLKLERIPTDLLLLLIEHAGELVTREEIVARVWGKDVYLDTDNSINGAIRKIRQVLKDDPEQPRFLQTVTGRGYRFIAPVTSPAAEAAAALAPVAASAPPPARERRRWPVLAGAAAIVVVVVAGYLLWARAHIRPLPSHGKLMLAVLPFENLTGDPNQDYFSDGMTEEMITQLGRLDPQHLGVIARTSVMHYKGSKEPIALMGRELGVQYVLEGSVRRAADRVRVTAQLIQVKDQTHVWARDYDRRLTDFLSVQSEIAQEIADSIQISLSGAAPASPAGPSNYEAYDLYLRGLYAWNKRTPEALRQSVTYFQGAIDKDPQFARAYAGLADAYGLLGTYDIVPGDQVMPKARAAALQALQINPSLPEAHTALALIAENYEWDWKTAEREFRRAIDLNPNYATAHHWYAECLAFQGNFDAALAESERARQLDPLSLIIAADNGAILYYARQYDPAIERFRATIDLDPAMTRAYLIVGAYAQKGEYKDALRELDRWQRNAPSPWVLSSRSYVLARAGHVAEARKALSQLRKDCHARGMNCEPMLASAYLGLGDRERALNLLTQAFQNHSGTLTALKVDPTYDVLRSDPRFQELLRDVHLAP